MFGGTWPRRFTAALLIGLPLNACDETPTGPGPTEVSATLDGRQWTADLRGLYPFATLDGQRLELRAVRTERAATGETATSTLLIRVSNYRGLGTYALGRDSGNHATYTYRIEPSGVSYATGGEIGGTVTIGAIDARDGWMSGSFAFDAHDGRVTTLRVRDGRFIGPLTRR